MTTPQDEEFDRLVCNARILTPEQRARLVQLGIERAKAYRAETIRNVFRSLFAWFRRRAAMAKLQQLDDRMLKDIGISRGDIEGVVRGCERQHGRAPDARTSGTLPVRKSPYDVGRAA